MSFLMNLEKRKSGLFPLKLQHSEAILCLAEYEEGPQFENLNRHPVSCPSPHFFIAFAVWRVNRKSGEHVS